LWLLHSHPELGDRWGYHIRQNHFYEPWPDVSQLTAEKVLNRREYPAINWHWNQQFNLLQELGKYSEEIAAIAQSPAQFNFLNGQFNSFDAAVYYALIRHLKPERIIEIGSGFSTHIAFLAIAKNAAAEKLCTMTCIEPYPQPYLTEAHLPIQLIPQKVEDLDLAMFQKLEAGDILFIDSTHTVKFGSDVCREILEILPSLKPGVWIHFHDVFFPLDYPPRWILEERRAWNEQYLLEAFLAYNSHFEITLANHWLTLDHPQRVAPLWPEVLDWQGSHHCGSLWIRRRSA